MLIFTSRDVNVTEATANGHLALSCARIQIFQWPSSCLKSCEWKKLNVYRLDSLQVCKLMTNSLEKCLIGQLTTVENLTQLPISLNENF